MKTLGVTQEGVVVRSEGVGGRPVTLVTLSKKSRLVRNRRAIWNASCKLTFSYDLG